MIIEITKHHNHHFLWIDDDCWMWDLDIEVTAQRELADRAYGDVLVAGYGLGILQSILVDRVTSVVTVEKYPEVLCENKRVFGKLYGDVIVDDFFNLNDDTLEFDTVIGDIWLDITPRHLGAWFAFRKKAEQLIRPTGQVLAWGDECFKVWETRR